MAYCDPPVETRFPVNRPHAPHTQKHPNGYLTSTLKKLLSADWDIKDAKIKKLLKNSNLKETVATALVLRRILNGCEGDDLAIERIFDRIDGKVPQKLEGAETQIHNHIIITTPSEKRNAVYPETVAV